MLAARTVFVERRMKKGVKKRTEVSRRRLEPPEVWDFMGYVPPPAAHFLLSAFSGRTSWNR